MHYILSAIKLLPFLFSDGGEDEEEALVIPEKDIALEKEINHFVNILREPRKAQFMYEEKFTSSEYIHMTPMSKHEITPLAFPVKLFMRYLDHHYVRRFILIQRVALIHTGLPEIARLFCKTLVKTVILECIKENHVVVYDEENGYRQFPAIRLFQ